MITDVSVSSTNVLPLGPSDEEGIQVDTHDYNYSCRVALSINGVSVATQQVSDCNLLKHIVIAHVFCVPPITCLPVA